MSPTQFMPFTGLIGGVLIGLAAIVLMAGNGRVMGASGIFGGLLTFKFDRDFAWRAIFMVSMLIAAAFTAQFTQMSQQVAFGTTPLFTAIGGVIVGVGTYLGNGCTSGHGICGNARFSKRSFISTCVFMAVAIITTTIVRHLGGV
jgi:uncharacterized protein